MIVDTLPADGPWWQGDVQNQTRNVGSTLPITLESLLLSALNHSSQIRVYSDLPLIRETAVIEADASFDSAAFVESRWDDTNDPVGNTLTTGGADRYQNNQWAGSGGLRKRTRVGGKLEVTQRFGWQDTNSTFFKPNVQGTAKLALSYTQPLLRGHGLEYNESLIVLAQLDQTVAEDEFSRQLQAHLLEVARSYWGLYLERSILLQKRKAVSRAIEVMTKLESRVEIDAVASQIQRAEAEVATRQSELVRAEMAVENAEARIRALVNDPMFGDNESAIELIPMDHPINEQINFDLHTSLTTALQTRPEISQAINQIKAGSVRSEMSRNEMLPMLNLVTETYLSGLQGSGSVGDAFTDQFRVGGPSYSIGLQYEVPLENRAAKTRNERRQLELRQLRNQYETTVQTLSLEVEVAVRELDTSYNEMLAQKRAMTASQSQLDYLEKRWELLPGEQGNAALMLENLFTAQERLMRSEAAYTQTWVTYNLALINHRRATGELLQQHQISWSDYVDECEGVKTRLLLKPDSTGLDLPLMDIQPPGDEPTVLEPQPVTSLQTGHDEESHEISPVDALDPIHSDELAPLSDDDQGRASPTDDQPDDESQAEQTSSVPTAAPAKKSIFGRLFKSKSK